MTVWVHWHAEDRVYFGCADADDYAVAASFVLEFAHVPEVCVSFYNGNGTSFFADGRDVTVSEVAERFTSINSNFASKIVDMTVLEGWAQKRKEVDGA